MTLKVWFIIKIYCKAFYFKTPLNSTVKYHQCCIEIDSCPKNSFNCSNGHCLSDLSKLCDEVDNCGDRSDENEFACGKGNYI